MSEEAKETKPSHRVSLTPETFRRLGEWHQQVEWKLKTISISRADLLNWFLETAPPELSKEQLQQIGSKFFDPLKAMQLATAQVREAMERGDKIDLKSIVFESISTGRAAGIKRKSMSKNNIHDS